MIYAYEQEVPIGEEVYRRIAERIGPAPLEGLMVHLVVKVDGGTLRYIDVWESREACERAFDERIHPAVEETFRAVGFRPQGHAVQRELALVEVRGLPLRKT